MKIYLTKIEQTFKNFSELEIYQRINKLAETSMRGLDELKFYTKEEALNALAAYKSKHPRKCKRAKVKIGNKNSST